MGMLSAKLGVPGPLAIAAAIATGAAIGLIHGVWITRFAVPSFVVTLAGLLGWQGALLLVLGDTGTVNLTDPAITGLTASFLGPIAGGALGLGCVVLLVVTQLRARRQRLAARLPAPPHHLRLVALVAIVVIAIAVLSADRGVPLALVLMLAIMIAFDFAIRRTRWGRHVFAVGGNADAARRAGIAVNQIRISVFTLAGTLAAIGGILAASRLLAVNQSSGGGDLLLNAIAAAVIGGTSLFGGRGSIGSALLGALVIGAISNGMDLLAVASSVKFIVTGAVLLLAVTLDAAALRPRLA